MTIKANTISIVPTGLYNNALRRQNIKLQIIDSDGQVGITPTDPSETVEMQVSDLVNRVCELDTILGLVVKSNVDRLGEKTARLRQLFEDGEIETQLNDLGPDFAKGIERDELDDLIAEMQSSVRAIRGVIEDHNKAVQK